MNPQPPAEPEKICSHGSQEPALNLSQARPLGIPAKLLNQDETIILMLRPSAWYILLRARGELLVLGLAAGLAFALKRLTQWGTYSENDLLALIAILAGARLIWQWAEWTGRLYILTDRRVLRIKGLLHQQVAQLPLRQISDVGIFNSQSERIAGLGTLSFAARHEDYSSVFWLILRHPDKIRSQVLETIERYGGPRPG